MPKIKDLGVKFIPETMRPPECGGFTNCTCTVITNPCIGCTHNFTFHQCVLHTTVTICRLPTHPCLLHTTVTGCVAFTTQTICPGGTCLGTCGFSPDPFHGGELPPEQIEILRQHMQTQLNALDELARNAGPKTADEIDAREKALNDELADLRARRKNLGK